MVPNQTGWYWLKTSARITSPRRYGWCNSIGPDEGPIMVFFRADNGKFYVVSKSGCLKAYRIPRDPTGAKWEGPLKPSRKMSNV